MRSGNNCCSPPLKAPEEDEGEIQEAILSLAAAKEKIVNTAVVTVLSELDGIFTLKHNMNNTGVFSHGKIYFCFTHTSFGDSLVFSLTVVHHS